MRTYISRVLLMTVMAAGILALGACGADDDKGTNPSNGSGSGGGKPVKVGIMLIGPKADGGWNQIWLDSVDALQKDAPEAEVTVLDNVNPGAQAQRAAERLARDGNDIVVATGGYADKDFARAMRSNRDVAFYNAFGTSSEDGLTPFDFGIEEGRYLDGIVAGSMTKSNVIGEVAGYPSPVSIRPLNALALGARSVNPDVKVKVLFVNSFYDPAKERQAGQALADEDADVLAMDTNTPALPSVAKQRDLRLLGYGLKRPDAGKSWLGSFSINWAPYLAEWVKAKQDGKTMSGIQYGGLKKGIIGSTEWASDIPQNVLDKVEDARRKIESGELKIFQGPITDTKGKEVVPDGEVLDTPQELSTCCDWYVPGVEAKD
ncbi:MAG TPA: BMP family ABC transporter substrate-binding protein [Thermoleophilaceae bacterium]|nr:BMP family ABC transporter substrate-binding protein [Thermoleophilaceae bacterium]